MREIVNGRTATVENVWVGDDYRNLALPCGPLQDLENALDKGPVELLRGFFDGSWRVEWVLQTIRYALIGGGMEPEAALKLVKTHCVSAMWGDYALKAREVLSAAISGVTADPVGEPQPVTETPKPAAELDGQTSTKSAALRASRRSKSAK